MVIKTVDELKEVSREILSKNLLERVSEERDKKFQELFNMNKMDFLFYGTCVIRVGKTFVTLYKTTEGDLWTIPHELITVFTILYNQVDYLDILRIRDNFLKRGISNLNEKEQKDFKFISRFIDLYTFCNIIDHTIFSGNVYKGSVDISKLMVNPEYFLDTELILDWLSEEFDITTIPSIQIDGTKQGKIYI